MPAVQFSHRVFQPAQFSYEKTCLGVSDSVATDAVAASRGAMGRLGLANAVGTEGDPQLRE